MHYLDGRSVQIPSELTRAGISVEDFSRYLAAIQDRNDAVSFLNEHWTANALESDLRDLHAVLQSFVTAENIAAQTQTGHYLARNHSTSGSQALLRLSVPLSNRDALANLAVHRARYRDAVQPPPSGFRGADGPPSSRGRQYEVGRRKRRMNFSRVLNVV